MEHRSPLENIFGIIGGLPQGHDKPIKHALYNTVALLILLLSCAATWALFLILEPFVKPLMWALLVGSVLHPLKRSLSDKFQAWFMSLEVSRTPIVFGVLLIPINIISDLSDCIGDQLMKHIKVIISTCITIPTILILYNYTPNLALSIFYKCFVVLAAILNFFLENASVSLVALILIGYMCLIFFFWNPANNTKFHYASIAIWLILSTCLAHLFGSFQLPIFIILQVIFFGGFMSEVYGIHKELKSDGHEITFFDSFLLAFHNTSSEHDVDEHVENIETTDDVNKPENTLPKTLEELPHVENEDASTNLETDSVAATHNRHISCDIKQRKPKNPYALELFEEEKDENVEDIKPQINTSSVFITNQGIHLIPDSGKPNVISNLSKQKSKRELLKRSMSQPQIMTKAKLKTQTAFLNFGSRISLPSPTHSLIDTDKYESTFYLYSVMWACVVMLFWKNIALIPLLPLPILLYCIKHAGIYFGLWNWIGDKSETCMNNIKDWCSARHDALVPVPIRGLYRIVDYINIFLKTSIRDSIDTVASCVVILGLTVFLACGSIFIVIQVYAEAIMLVQMTGNVINQTVVHNPELRQLLPPAWDDTVDSILDNAYQYGREGISKAVKGVMADVDSAKSEKLEKQILELWDRVYQSWMSSNDGNGPQVTQEAVNMSWESFLADVKRSPEMFNLNGILEFGKQNVGTLLSLSESVWSIVKGNIGLLLGSLSAFLSVILGGGTAVFNFILNGIVFLTTLFYLLSCSGELYKPVEVMTKFSTNGRRFGTALEGAINGVFTASLKMAIFYGLWTWFIHNLFGVKIVYLPSAFATILGAVPFLGTYWACFPAVLDLWLAQDRSIEAILFAIFQFLPTSIVDTTIYKEIKGGGHPYLTGLAIAGGIFCLGVEGAIIGPLLLCGLLVGVDLSSTLFKESPSEESINLRLQLHDR